MFFNEVKPFEGRLNAVWIEQKSESQRRFHGPTEQNAAPLSWLEPLHRTGTLGRRWFDERPGVLLCADSGLELGPSLGGLYLLR